MNEKKYLLELTGTMPLLMHADNLMAGEAVKAWQKDPANKSKSVAGDDRTPAWTWMSYTYDDGEHIALPQEMLMACLCNGGAKVIMHKQTTFKAATQSSITPTLEYFQFFASGNQVPLQSITKLKAKEFSQQADGVRELGFCLFVKRVVVGQKRHVRVRPRFNTWSARGFVVVDDEVIKRETLQQILDICGSKVGLGDWRPSAKKPGPFGTFTATLKNA